MGAQAASSDDALRPAQGRLLEGAAVLVQEGVDAVGRGRAAVPHNGLCWRGKQNRRVPLKRTQRLVKFGSPTADHAA